MDEWLRSLAPIELMGLMVVVFGSIGGIAFGVLLSVLCNVPPFNFRDRKK